MQQNNQKVATLELLLVHYNKLNNDPLPQSNPKSEWNLDNKFGFLKGIIEYGLDIHINKLHNLLSSDESQESFIDELFDFYIRPFHQHYGDGSSCHNPSKNSSKSSSRANSLVDMNYIPTLSSADFKREISARDSVCLFCWSLEVIEGAHIIAQKNANSVAYNDESLLQRVGLEQKHQVQNGLLLCSNCHKRFDALKRYVDVIGNKLVLKIVNDSRVPNDQDDVEWRRVIRNVKASRLSNEEDWIDIDNRKSVDENGDMCLWFMKNDLSLQPNRNALEFHKTACLIWRMAGGGDPEEDCSDEDDFESVDDLQKIRLQMWNSAATMNVEPQ